MNARASLVAGGTVLTFPVNPYSASWNYSENTVSQDTIGGRVVQLLSVNINNLTVQTVAGSRNELQRMATGLQEIMKWHIRTSRPAKFRVPSREWDFDVFVTNVPQLGWDITTTTYPYNINMAIQEDVGGNKTKQILGSQLERLAAGIGYNPGVHGGDAATIEEMVKSLVGVAAQSNSTPTDSNGTGSGSGASGDGQYQGDGKFPGKASSAPWTDGKLRDVVYDAWNYAGGAQVAKRMMCVAERESGWNPSSINKTLNANGSWDIGLFQINTLYAGRRQSQGWTVTGTLPTGVSWWPADYHTMLNAEYNTRCAIDIFQRAGHSLSPWATIGSNQC